MGSKNNVIKPRKSNIVFKAIQFAVEAHAGQFRTATRDLTDLVRKGVFFTF